MKTVTTIRLPEDLTKAMVKLHARDGISQSEQMRRALAAFLKAKGVYTPKKENKR